MIGILKRRSEERGKMKIIIHKHGDSLAEDFNDIAIERLERLSRFNVKIDRIDVDVTHEVNPHFGKKSSHHVKITSHGSGPFFRAEARAFNDLAAFDEAAETLEFQLRKAHERTKEVSRETLRKKKAI